MPLFRARFVALSAASLLIPHSADAQFASRLEAGGLHTDASGQAAIPSNIWRIAPTMGIKGAHGSVSGSGSLWWPDGENARLVDATIGGTLVGPTIYGVRAELIGNASRAMDDRSLGADQVDVGTRINFLFNRKAGAWVGGGVARPWRVTVLSTIDLLNAGAWMDVGRATFTMTGTTLGMRKMGTPEELGGAGSCTAPNPSPSGVGENDGAAMRLAPAPVTTTDCHYRSSVTDLTLSGRWNLDRIEFAGEAGHRLGRVADVATDSRNWSSGTMTMWVAPRAAFVWAEDASPRTRRAEYRLGHSAPSG